MPEQKKYTDEEMQEIRNKTEESLQRASEIIQKFTEGQDEFMKKSDALTLKIKENLDRTTALSEKNEKAIAELSNTSRNHGKLIGDLGNKFGTYTEALAEPSLKRILDERFDADYQGWLAHGESKGFKDLEVDGWAKSRNGSGAAFLVEVKSKFKPKHIRQVWRTVEKFREFKLEYRHREVYPILAVVEVKDSHRDLIWQSGIILFDIADGVFKMPKPPADFKPNGYHGSDAVRRDVPYLHLIKNDDSRKQSAQ